jgi:hypothetical protein
MEKPTSTHPSINRGRKIKWIKAKMRCSTCGHEFTLSLIDEEGLRRYLFEGLDCEYVRCLPCFRANRKWSVVVLSIT